MAGSLTPHKQFATTRWTMVLAAGRDTPGPARQALAQLCQTYWYPLYAYVRRKGHAPQDAEDLTQAFLARLLEKNVVAAARRERGKFRSFLLASLNHFLSDEWDKARAQKRGGLKVVALDGLSAESRYAVQPRDHMTPEKLFERQWALRLLEEVLRRLEEEFVSAGKGELFDCLRHCLTGDRGALPYAALAERLGMTQEAVKVAVHRLRQRYRELLRQEIAQTVASVEDVEDELRMLRQALAE